MNKRSVFLWLFVLAAMVSLPPPAAGQAGMTNTPLTQCINDGTDVTCKSKQIVNVGVSYGVRAVLNVVYSDQTTFSFVLSKSEPTFVYPLTSIDLLDQGVATISLQSRAIGLPRMPLTGPAPAPFQSYAIGPPQRSYSVTAIITQGTVEVNSITVSTDSPECLNANQPHQIDMKLVGEGQPPAASPDFSNDILFDWNNYFLLVPTAMLPAGNDTNLASDIASLLNRLLSEDRALLASNPSANTNYLVSGMNVFKGAALPSASNLVLEVMDPNLNYSTVYLMLDTAQIEPVMSAPVAYIRTASAQTFNSMSNDGTLQFVVVNAGAITGDYIATITYCQPNMVGAVPAQGITLAAGAQGTVNFNIATSNKSSSTRFCYATLMAASSQVFDQLQVFFNTN